jgi:branched-chain amino acid transport system substrate-binding protein
VEDRIGLQFATDTSFTTVQVASGKNEKSARVDDSLLESLGRVPSTYASSSYDAVWLVGLSIEAAQSTEVADVAAVIPDVAASHSGALGSIALNAAGDLAQTNYDVWKIVDAEWTLLGIYYSATDTVELEVAESAIEGAVAVGSLLPLTGDLAKHGEENYAASLLAVDDFNQYLEEKGAGWYLDVISEDSETRPTVALEKLQALHAKGVKIVLGPETSSNLRNIKGYADSNQMLLVSCCSTSPSLAIEGDTTFRMSPDDSNQGTATAKLMVDAGIEVVVPVWRDDAWGTGLHEAATESFTGRGGTADDGLSYNPEAAEFSAEASLLADAVQGYVDEYGADKVAVLYIGFGEVVAFMQSASSYDILHEVQWFGSDANTKDPSIVEDRIGLQFATDTSFTTVQVASGKNEKSARVDDSLLESLGRVPSTYASSSYDSVWLVGLAIETAQSTEVADVVEAIPGVAASHTGALGSIALNAAGDLAQTNYDVWKIVDAQWNQVGIYYSATDTVELAAAEEVPVDTTETPPTEQQPSGCLIATAAYGSELAPQVQFLREIRDGTLLQTAAGTSLMTGFNQFYYSFSPAVADLERESPIFRDAVKTAITPAIYALNIMALADSDSEVSVLALAIVSICAIAGIYVVGPSLAVYGVARRVRR